MILFQNVIRMNELLLRAHGKGHSRVPLCGGEHLTEFRASSLQSSEERRIVGIVYVRPIGLKSAAQVVTVYLSTSEASSWRPLQATRCAIPRPFRLKEG